MGCGGSKSAAAAQEPQRSGGEQSEKKKEPPPPADGVRRPSIVDAQIYTSEIRLAENDRQAANELGRTRHAKARMRAIERDRLESERRDRALTVEQQKFEDSIDQEATENQYLKRVIQALNTFKVTDPVQRRDIIENYQVLDAERVGYVQAEELRLLAETIDYKLPMEKISGLISAADVSGDGRIRAREFVRTLVDVRRMATEQREEALESFRVMDEENKGYVALEELKDLMGSVDDRCTPERIDRFAAERKLGADGIVTADEFLVLLQLCQQDA